MPVTIPPNGNENHFPPSYELPQGPWFNTVVPDELCDFLTFDELRAGVQVHVGRRGQLYRDFTRPLEHALAGAVRQARSTNDPWWFYNIVNHRAPWDIKREEPWNRTVTGGIPTWPGFGNPVYFRGSIGDVEYLGNYTYGYIGAAFGFPLSALILGSIYAAPLGTHAQRVNEVQDWSPITRGFESAVRRGSASTGNTLRPDWGGAS